MSNWSQRIAKRAAVLKQIKNPGDVLLAIQVVTVAAIVPLITRLPLDTLSRIITPRSVPQAVDPRRVTQLTALIPAVLHAGCPFLRTHCLPRGLVLYYFLRRAGLEVELCFGMGASKGEYSGHCWLSSQGSPYLENGDPTPRYVEFYRFPTGPVNGPTPDARLSPGDARVDS